MWPILLEKITEQSQGLLAYYHLVERSAQGVQYKIASEIAIWLFLLGPTKKWYTPCSSCGKPGLFRLIGRKYCDAVKCRCFEKQTSMQTIQYEWFYTC